MRKRVAIIGAGPGGYVAAIRAAQLKYQVTLIERDYIGGVCLNVGCIPSKALITVAKDYKHRMLETPYGLESKETSLDFTKTQQWKDKTVIAPLTGGIEALLLRNKVKILRGEAIFETKNSLSVKTSNNLEKVEFDYAIIATGSRPIELKNFKFDHKNVIDSTDLLNLKEIPKSLAVVGGGYIGSELANIYANFGTKVTIIEGQSSILSNFDADMSKLVHSQFVDQGIQIETDSMVDSYTHDEELILSYLKKGKKETLKTEKILVSVGRTPNTDGLNLEKAGIELEKSKHIKVDSQLRTSQKHIFAIGDVVVGAALAHKASYEAKFVMEVIEGSKDNIGQLIIPSVCFTDTECASVGISAKDAKEMKSKYKVSIFPWAANGRAIANNDTEGFVRIINLKENNQIVGAQIVGHNAGELITQLTQAIEAELVLEDIALTIHPHPSQSEAIMDGAELALGYPIHI